MCMFTPHFNGEINCNQLESVQLCFVMHAFLLGVKQDLFFKTCQMNDDILKTSLRTLEQKF